MPLFVVGSHMTTHGHDSLLWETSLNRWAAIWLYQWLWYLWNIYPQANYTIAKNEHNSNLCTLHSLFTL